MNDNILEAYSDGNSIQMIAENYNMAEGDVLQTLLKHKEESRYKKTFNDDFKKMIANRDINGVSRSDIARELKINALTVKKSCVEFGQAVKEKSTSNNTYTEMKGEFDIKLCPSCGSRRNNLVDEENTTYCMSCDSEHEYYDYNKEIDRYKHVKKINFEYID